MHLPYRDGRSPVLQAGPDIIGSYDERTRKTLNIIRIRDCAVLR